MMIKIKIFKKLFKNKKIITKINMNLLDKNNNKKKIYSCFKIKIISAKIKN